MRIESGEQFEALREEIRSTADANGNRILVCCGTGCLANGARKVAEAFAEQVGKRNMDAQVNLMVKNTGCPSSSSRSSASFSER